MRRALPTGFRSGRARLGARLEVLAVVFGVPLALIASLGRSAVLHRPYPPTLADLRQLFAAPAQIKLDALGHAAVWVVWILWAYCVFAVVLSAVGGVAQRLRPGGPASAILRMRNRVVPASVRLILDSVFVAALIAPSMRASAAVGSLPVRTPVTAQVVPPAAPPAAPAQPQGEGLHARRARLLAQTTDQPSPPTTYVVRRGDTLSHIAQEECGAASQWPVIAQANGTLIPRPGLIHAGTPLAIPCATPAQTVGSAGDVHVVAGGESLYTIAEQYAPPGCSPSGIESKAMDIFDANQGTVVGAMGERLERPRFIEPGWRLVIPGDVSGGTALTPLPAPAPAAPTVPPVIPAVSSPAPVAPHPSESAPAAVGPVVSPSAAVSDPVGQVAPRATAAPPSAPVALPAAHHSLNGRTHGMPVRLPGGYVIPASLAAALLGFAVRARAKHLRDARLGSDPEPVAPEGPNLTAIRRADIAPSYDGVGPIAEAVLQAWATDRAGEVPAVLACWESGADTAFLLEVPDEEALPGPSVVGEVQVHFEAEEGGVWAIAAGGGPGRVWRGSYAFADGLMVPVGNREEEAALHMPLFGPPVSIQGPQAAAVAEAMVLAAQARCSPDDLSVVVVGAGGGAFENALGGADADLPEIRHARLEEQEQLRLELETLVLANATAVADYGLDSLAQQALHHPDDRLRTTLVVLDAALVSAWAPLLTRGRDLGVCALVVGEWASAERVLVIDDEGLLHVQAPGLDPVVITPCVVPAAAMQEVAAVVGGEGEDDLDPEQAGEPETAPAPAALAVPSGAAIRIQLFGGMDVQNAAGESVAQPFRGRRATRDVLAFLAAHPGWQRKEVVRQAIWEVDGLKGVQEELWAAVSEARHWLVDALDPAPDQAGVTPVSSIGRTLIQQRNAQGYRLDSERVSVDLADFEQAFAAAKAQPGSPEALATVVAAYAGNLLEQEANPDAFTWVEREGLRIVQQEKVAWAAVALAGLLQEQGRPDRAFKVLEPLLDAVVNEELWLCAMQCQGEPAPRGLGDRGRLMDLYARYQAHLRTVALPGPTDRAELAYKSLLMATAARESFVAAEQGDIQPASRLRPVHVVGAEPARSTPEGERSPHPVRPGAPVSGRSG